MTRAARARLGWQKAALALAFVGFALALAGIWSTAAPADGTIARASKTATVTIDNFKFTPGTVRVAKGSSVRFSNSSGITHTATSAGAFDTGRIRDGKSVTVRFTQKGAFAYHCTIHPFMKGKVVVD
jgi:plastocyanin